MSPDHEDIAMSPPGAVVDPAQAGRTLPLSPREGEATLALPGAPVATPAVAGTPDATLALAAGSCVTPATFALAAAEVRVLPPSRESLPVIDEDRYIVEREVARGGMGRVLLAQDRRLRRPVAVKEMLSADAAELVRRFEREALLTARLQHPSIVSVHEAGRWPSGAPFYTMELVRGRSLEDAIAAAQSLPERMALLVQAIAAVEALGYAHSQRVVHRDLKPANIMVGSFGETVVIDWGLAKDLSDLHDDGAGMPLSASTPDADSGLTGVGAVVGTPMYMSPEQAGGTPVDERSDVYSLGAILYHLLVGATPFESGTAHELLLRVRSRRRPEALGVRAPGVPSDLVAIVEKAMSPAPEERYPTAVELAADLKRFQTGQLVGAHAYTLGQLARRWLRRHRAEVAVAGVLLVAMAGMAVIGVRRIVVARVAAERARDHEREQRVAAEGLVDFVLTDLRKQVAATGRLEPLFGIGTEVGRYYQRLSGPVADTDVPSLRQRARALDMVADVLDARGEREGSLRACTDALSLRERLAVLLPGEPMTRRELARSRICRARSLGEADGQGAAAEAELAQARDLLAPLAPADAESASLYAAVLLELGDRALNRDDLVGAETVYRAALATLMPRADDAETADLRVNLARAHERLGVLEGRRGHFDVALGEHRASLAVYEKMGAALGAPPLRSKLGAAHSKIGDMLSASGKLADAQVEYTQALATSERLLEIEPSNNDWLHEVAGAASDLGTAQLRQKDMAGAKVSFTRSYAAILEASRRDPTSTRLQRHVAVALSKLGQIEQDRGERSAALGHYQDAVTILARVHALEPDNAVAIQQLAIGYSYVGDLELALHHVPEALAAYTALVALMEGPAARGTTDVETQKILAVGLSMVASVHELPGGDRARAGAELDRGIAILTKLKAAGGLDDEGAGYLAEFQARRAKLK